MKGNALITALQIVGDKIHEKPSFDDFNQEYSWFCDVCDVCEDIGVKARVVEHSHMAPRIEKRTVDKQVSKEVPTRDGGVRLETVTKKEEKRVVVGERKKTTGFSLNIGESEEDKQLVCAIAHRTGLEAEEAPAYKPYKYTIE